MTLRPLQFITLCACGLIVGIAIAFSLMYAGYEIGEGMKKRAEADVVIAFYGKREAELKAMDSYLKLEAMRTNLETANRKVAMAEYRLAAVCKKTKTRC